LLAHHFTRAGLTEAAIEWWGKAGQRSLARSALVEAAEQLTQALSQIKAVSPTPALRREQIKLQVALIHALTHTKGHAAAETKAAVEQAHLLIEQAEALGEPAEDPLLLFSVLFGFWVAHYVAFNGNAMCQLAAQFLVLAEKQRAVAPVMIAHRIMGISLTSTGDIVDGKAHLDRAIALYDPAAHRPLPTLFAVDDRVSSLSYRFVAASCKRAEIVPGDSIVNLRIPRRVLSRRALIRSAAVAMVVSLRRGAWCTESVLKG
jgi:hypothetical protein